MPDCRAWEQVSPQDKGGNNAVSPADPGYAWASTSGDGLGFESAGGNAFPGTPGSDLENAYAETRGSAGWQTTDATPPLDSGDSVGAYFLGYDFSTDLQHEVTWVPNDQLTPDAPAGVENIFLSRPGGPYRLIDPAPPIPACSPSTMATNLFGVNCWQLVDRSVFSGASSDYSHIIFESNGGLTPDAPPGLFTTELYENVNGATSLVGVLPDGTVAPGGAQAGSGELVFGSYSQGAAQDIQNAISSDGSRIFFRAAADAGPPDPAQAGDTEVYERVNGNSTVEVSAPAAGSSPANSAAEPATYWGASTDGSLVLFTSSAELTSDANTGTSNGGNDLYEFDTVTNTLKDLTVDSNAADSNGASVLGVTGMSADGSIVYFVASGVLTSAPNAHNATAQSGQPNLYVYSGGQIQFIATLASADGADWTNKTGYTQAYITPDGQHMAFMSTASLTGYNNTDQSTGQPDDEVYQYDASSGTLTCASCDPSGAQPLGPAYLGNRYSPNLYAGATAFYRSRSLSDKGTRLFFSSPDPLTTGAGSKYDKVYELEQDGTGSCTSAGGCLYLLGAATTGNDAFLDADPSGDNVFIATGDQLLPSDTDQLMDIYDARVEGGFPPPTAPVQCQGDSCQGQASTAPPLSVAGTVTFAGPSNQRSRGRRTVRVRLAAKPAHGFRFILRVTVPARGRIVVHGVDVRAITRTARRAQTFRLVVRLLPRAERVLRRERRIRAVVKVLYKPANGRSSTASIRLSLKA